MGAFECLKCLFEVVEMVPGCTDDLVVLVALARQQDHIVVRGVGNCLPDRQAAICLDNGRHRGRGREAENDFVDDSPGVLRSRVVTGDVECIRELLEARVAPSAKAART